MLSGRMRVVRVFLRWQDAGQGHSIRESSSSPIRGMTIKEGPLTETRSGAKIHLCANFEKVLSERHTYSRDLTPRHKMHLKPHTARYPDIS